MVYTGNNHTMGWILSNFRLSGELVGLDEGHIPWALDLLKGDIEGYNKDSKWSDGGKK